MFGYVTVSFEELTSQEKVRYNSIYCGICRQIRNRSSQLSRLGLSYDMAFLALLLMSLYEPCVKDFIVYDGYKIKKGSVSTALYL